MTDELIETMRKRLSIRAWRRGTREMDLILGRFAERSLATMSRAELVLFERLLAESDTDLFDWFLEREMPPALFLALIKQIQSKEHDSPLSK